MRRRYAGGGKKRGKITPGKRREKGERCAQKKKSRGGNESGALRYGKEGERNRPQKKRNHEDTAREATPIRHYNFEKNAEGKKPPALKGGEKRESAREPAGMPPSNGHAKGP